MRRASSLALHNLIQAVLTQVNILANQAFKASSPYGFHSAAITAVIMVQYLRLIRVFQLVIVLPRLCSLIQHVCYALFTYIEVGYLLRLPAPLPWVDVLATLVTMQLISPLFEHFSLGKCHDLVPEGQPALS